MPLPIKPFVLLSVVSWGAATALPAVDVRLDFAVRETVITGADGASCCQFDRGRPYGSPGNKAAHNWDRGVARTNYSRLGGFPDDASTTDFGQFMDACYALDGQGMALHHLWFTPNPHQSPKGSHALGTTYDACDWSKLDFSMYLGTTQLGSKRDPSTSEFWITNGAGYTVRGQTVPIAKAAVRRARDADARMMLWMDLHFTFPCDLWRSSTDPRLRTDADTYAKACLYEATFIKYLATVHGIPMQALSFINEPNVSGDERPRFTDDQFLEIIPILRRKLDESGLSGIKISPYTPYRYSSIVRLAEETGASGYAAFLDAVDVWAGHTFGGEGLNGSVTDIPNTETWVGSGTYSGYWTGSSKWGIGGDENIDEVIRLGTWRIKGRYELSSMWNLYNRAGLCDGTGLYDMPTTYDPTGERQIWGAAVAWRHVRPGMAIVGGSQGREPDQSYSVDGFAGPGKPSVILITNSDSARTFDIDVVNLGGVTGFEVYQTDKNNAPRTRAAVTMSSGAVSVEVPADSVTALVAKAVTETPRVRLLVADANSMTARDAGIRDALTAAGSQVQVLSQVLTQAQKNATKEKRHPVLPMETAAYVIAPSVTDLACIRAHDYVMAPVIACGATASDELNLHLGSRVDAGASLDLRNPLDPPATMLPDGVPVATGRRTALELDAADTTITSALAWAIDLPDVNNLRPVILTGPTVTDNPVSDTNTDLQVSAEDPDDDPLTYVWNATGPAMVTFSPANSPTPTATFTGTGTYTISLTVSDGRGGTTRQNLENVVVNQTASGLTITP